MNRRSRLEPPSPAFRIIALALLLIASAAVDLSSRIGLGVLTAGAVTALLVCPGAWRIFLHRLAPLGSFIVIGGLLVLFAPTPDSAEAMRLPLIERDVNASSARFMLALTVHCVLIVAYVTAFAQVLSERDVLEAFGTVRPLEGLTTLLYLTVRALHLVGDEVWALVRAREARGRPRGLRALTVAAAMAQVLMIRLARRAETQAMALVSRGFERGLKVLDPRPLRLAEALALAPMAVLLWCLVRL